MKKFTANLVSVLSILGCVLGAGFISGAEINSFFLRFGAMGILGVVLSAILFAIIIYFTIKPLTNKYNKMQKIAKKLNFLPFCQVFISGAMVSGMVNVISGYGINKFAVYAMIFVTLLCCLLVGIKSANIINVIVSLCLCLLLPFVIFGIKDFAFTGLNFSFGMFLPSVLFAVFYVAMNAVASNEVIKHASRIRASAISVSVFSGITLLVLTLLVLVIIAGTGAGGQMPMLSVISSPWLKVMYSMLFVVAMLSTLLSSSMGAKNAFKNMQSNLIESLCTTFAIFSVALIGFSNIVMYVYPLIGVVMIIQFAVNAIKNKQYANAA